MGSHGENNDNRTVIGCITHIDDNNKSLICYHYSLSAAPLAFDLTITLATCLPYVIETRNSPSGKECNLLLYKMHIVEQAIDPQADKSCNFSWQAQRRATKSFFVQK